MAGHHATVWIQARGRKLRANVAGKRQGWFDADDYFGMFTMVAKGGKAVVHRLEFTPVAMPLWHWSPSLWVGLGVLAAAMIAVGVAMCSRRRPLVGCGVVMLFFAWALVRRVDTDIGLPSPGAMLALLAAITVLAVMPCLAELRSWRLWVAGAVVFFLMQLASFGHDTARVDEVFGPKAGSSISEAHGQLVRGPQGLLHVRHEGPCIFLLGGQPLYDRGRPSDHLAIGLQSRLRGLTRQKVKVPALPTSNGYSVSQQWRLFESFYQGFAPQVIVFGVGAGNDEGEDLRGVLQQVRAHCESNQCLLVLFAAGELEPSALATLREFEAAGVPLVRAAATDEPAAIVRRLADVITPQLK